MISIANKQKRTHTKPKRPTDEQNEQRAHHRFVRLPYVQRVVNWFVAAFVLRSVHSFSIQQASVSFMLATMQSQLEKANYLKINFELKSTISIEWCLCQHNLFQIMRKEYITMSFFFFDHLFMYNCEWTFVRIRNKIITNYVQRTIAFPFLSLCLSLFFLTFYFHIQSK